MKYLSEQIDQVLPDRPDLIVLPERCYVPTPFVQAPAKTDDLLEFLASREPQVQEFISEIAKSNRCYVAYPSYKVFEDGQRSNSIFFFGRDGQIVGTYDKCRLTPGEVSAGVKPGRQAVVLDCDLGRVGFVICFDLNYFELLQEYCQLDPDLLVFSSMYHGGLMQSVWAYACRCHFVGSVGPEGLPSEVLLPTGDVFASSTNYTNHVSATINLDCLLVHLDVLHETLGNLKKTYGTKVKLYDPGMLGSVLLSAEDDNLSIREVVSRFDLNSLDEYLDQSRSMCFPVDLSHD